MMDIELTNNWMIIPDGTLISANIKSVLSFYEKSKTIRTKKRQVQIPAKINYAYTVANGMIYVPVGLYPLLSEYITIDVNVVDHRKVNNPNLLQVQTVFQNIDDYADILPGITLKKHQLLAIRKILYAKRGIINACTGAGKTEVMVATTKILKQVNNSVCPTILIFEPTVKLVNDTVKRFKRYGVEAVAYSKSRRVLPNVVNIAHPKSLGNDLEVNPQLLNDVEVLFGDETHHFSSDTYRTPTYDMPSLVYSIGVSASAISQEHVGCKNVHQFSYNEVLTIGATGPLLLNITADHLIAKGDLAMPVLMRVKYECTEPIQEKAKTDWHEVSKVHLQSNKRNHLICRVAELFIRNDRKVLILVNTVEWSRKILGLLHMMNLESVSVASYGGGKFEVTNPNHFKPEFLKGPKDSFEKFDTGEFKILIGTSHIYEGADISKLDTIILAYGGKAERLQVQGIGRALRKTKTGKYAYVIDFTDDNDIVLSKHSKTRMKRYRDVIGVPEDNIYDSVDENKVEEIFKRLEGL